MKKTEVEGQERGGEGEDRGNSPLQPKGGGNRREGDLSIHVKPGFSMFVVLL